MALRALAFRETFNYTDSVHNSNRFSQSKVLYVSVSVFVYVSMQEGWGKQPTLSVFHNKSPSY